MLNVDNVSGRNIASVTRSSANYKFRTLHMMQAQLTKRRPEMSKVSKKYTLLVTGVICTGNNVSGQRNGDKGKERTWGQKIVLGLIPDTFPWAVHRMLPIFKCPPLRRFDKGSSFWVLGVDG
jgi:hypothetical protein